MDNTPWHELPLVGFDLETTGRNPKECRIVSAALIIVDGQGKTLHERTWLVDPGVPIPEGAAAVHGISTEKAQAEGTPAAEGVQSITDAIHEVLDANLSLVAFNGAYDFTCLVHEQQRHGIPLTSAKPVVDPFILQKQVDRYRKGKRTLGALCEGYGVELDNAHDAAADALAAVLLARAFGKKFPALNMSANDLHTKQVAWAAEQAADFQAFKRRTDPQATIDGGWPTYSGSPA